MTSHITIGLTGGIGSGKSFVSDCFKSLGVDIIDADTLSRTITGPNQAVLIDIAERFGADILDENGNLLRPKLRSIIFNDTVEKQWLEELLHPIIRTSIVSELNKSCNNYRILSSPLLFETHQDELVDYVLVVDVPISVQMERASSRDGSDPKMIQCIMETQMNRDVRVGLSDFVINNEGGKENTVGVIKNLHEHFLTLTK